MTAVPRVGALIVHYVREDLTEEVLTGLLTVSPARLSTVVVVDNGSPTPWQVPAGVQRAAAAAGVELIAIRAAQPGGFAAAVNLARTGTRAEVLALVNNDITLNADPFPALLDRLAAGAGIVGPRVTFPDGRGQLSWGADLTLAEERRERRRFRAQHAGAPAPPERDVPAARPVDWVSGAFLCVRAEVFDAVGGLDERYTFYYEDVDFCRRVREAGWSTWYEPAACVSHALNATHDTVSRPGGAADRLARARATGHVRYYATHVGGPATLAVRTLETVRAVQRARGRAPRTTWSLIADLWSPAEGSPSSSARSLAPPPTPE